MYTGISQHINNQWGLGNRILKCKIGDKIPSVLINDDLLGSVGDMVIVDNKLYCTAFSAYNRSSILRIDLL